MMPRTPFNMGGETQAMQISSLQRSPRSAHLNHASNRFGKLLNRKPQGVVDSKAASETEPANTQNGRSQHRKGLSILMLLTLLTGSGCVVSPYPPVLGGSIDVTIGGGRGHRGGGHHHVPHCHTTPGYWRTNHWGQSFWVPSQTYCR